MLGFAVNCDVTSGTGSGGRAYAGSESVMMLSCAGRADIAADSSSITRWYLSTILGFEILRTSS